MLLSRAAIRLLVGPLFIGHGTQKLFGWFGGHGIEATGGAFESMGLKPGKRHATAAGASEALGGAMIALGALTPIGAALISGSMVTAIRKVHAAKGPWVAEGGFEYNVVLLGAMAAITEIGPGRPSVDARYFPKFRGTALGIVQLLAAVVGSFLATSPALNEAAATTSEQTGEIPGDPAARPSAATSGDREPAPTRA
jgi:putative oxidoreductase